MKNKEHIRELIQAAETSIEARKSLIELYILFKRNVKVNIDLYRSDSRLFDSAYKKADAYFMSKVGGMTIWDKFGNFIKKIF